MKWLIENENETKKNFHLFRVHDSTENNFNESLRRKCPKANTANNFVFFKKD